MATCTPGSTGDYCCDTTASTSCCSRMDRLDLRDIAAVRAVTTTSPTVKSSSSVKTTSSSDKASTTSSGKSSSHTQSSSQVSLTKSSTLLTTTTATPTTSTTSTSSTSSISTISSPTATPTTAPASSGMSTPVKIGAVAGGVVGLALVGFLFWMVAFLFRRRRQNKINAERARELEMRALNTVRFPPGGPGNKGAFSNSVDEIETTSRPLRTQTPQYGRDYGSGNNRTSRIFENPLAPAHQYGPVPPEEEYSDPQYEVGRRPSQQQYQSIPRRKPSQPGGFPAQQQQYVAFSPIEPPSQSPVATYPGQQQYIPTRQPSQPSTARYEMGYSSSPTQFQTSPPPARPFSGLASPIERQMTPAEELAAARARSNLSRAGELRDDTGGGLNPSLSIVSAPGREGPGGGRAYHEL
jgi:hypothetical protein